MMKRKIQQLIKRFSENNIAAVYVETRTDALEAVMSMIPERSIVGFGDSLTLRQISVVDALKEGDYTFLNPWKPGSHFAMPKKLVCHCSKLKPMLQPSH